MYEDLSLQELRKLWAKHWSLSPHKGIGRSMMTKSIAFKTHERLTQDQQKRLNELVKRYKRNPRCFDDGCTNFKPGTRLIRNWKGASHVVTASANGFDYQGKHYTSLSKIANDITGSRWNGRVFFGLKNKAKQ